MPELLEVEAYRTAAAAAVGRTICEVSAPDAWFVKRGASPAMLRQDLTGARVTAARRIGKLLVIDTDGPRLGLRFGMTGRILVDGAAPIAKLLNTSSRYVPRWDRFGLGFRDGGTLVVRDPRRLGGVELDPNEAALGPDAATLTQAQLDAALGRSAAPLKARLMDQSRLAGLGNLLTDELLWRAGLAPTRPAGSLDGAEQARLLEAVRRTLAVLGERGGSHTGDLQPSRVRGGRCPRDGSALLRASVGGRTAFWCPRHQR